jgi:CRISPR-associated protein Cas1
LKNQRTQKIFLDGNGQYLARGEGCLIVKDRNGKVAKYPLMEDQIGEVQIKNGNSVSSAALQTLAFWGIDTMIMTQRGRPVAYLRYLDDDSHVATRVGQYEALKGQKGLDIAKQIVLAKIEGQNHILRKYGFREHNVIDVKKRTARADARSKLMAIEGHTTQQYFDQIFTLLPKALSIERRRTYKAYDGINNTFNLAYTVLKWKVHRALLKAKLEPYLGFLHSEAWGKPSLVCDLMELYRYLIDDFIIRYCRNLKKKDFAMKHENYSHSRKGERQYLNKDKGKNFMRSLNSFFESVVQIPRIRHGSKQSVETLINEEALLLAGHLRDEKPNWHPRIPSFPEATQLEPPPE